MQYLIRFCSLLETASDPIPGSFVLLTVPDKCVNFRALRSNRSPEIRPEAVGDGIFDRFFKTSNNCKPEAASDVKSGAVVQHVGVDVFVEFGDSRSSLSRDIRLPHFVTNDTGVRRSSHKAFCLKTI